MGPHQLVSCVRTATYLPLASKTSRNSLTRLDLMMIAQTPSKSQCTSELSSINVSHTSSLKLIPNSSPSKIQCNSGSPSSDTREQADLPRSNPELSLSYCQPSSSSQKPSDFSIDHILRCAGPRQVLPTSSPSPPLFDWLHCTRYHPPKLQRSKKKEGSYNGSGVRRKLGRNPRIPFSAAQVAVLEEMFRGSAYLSASDVSHLATLLRLSDNRIKIWFQNRRARERRDHGRVEVSQTQLPKRQVLGAVIKSAFTPTEGKH